jgi:hypothetical protein
LTVTVSRRVEVSLVDAAVAGEAITAVASAVAAMSAQDARFRMSHSLCLFV